MPSALFLVEASSVSDLGSNQVSPVVQSRRTSQEKAPWKDLPVPDAHKQGMPLLRGNVEAQFVRPLYLGESVAPFRLLEPALAVIPWEDASSSLIDSSAAQRKGYVHLADWLERAEYLWGEHNRGTMTLTLLLSKPSPSRGASIRMR